VLRHKEMISFVGNSNDLHIDGNSKNLHIDGKKVFKRVFWHRRTGSESYVLWTVHHLDSWIKRDQLDVTCFIISLFNAQDVSDVNTSILRSLRLIYWVISWVVLLWFDVCWRYVVVWLGWCGAVPQPAYGYHTTPPQPNHNVTPTHIEPEQYNPRNN